MCRLVFLEIWSSRKTRNITITDIENIRCQCYSPSYLIFSDICDLTVRFSVSARDIRLQGWMLYMGCWLGVKHHLAGHWS